MKRYVCDEIHLKMNLTRATIGSASQIERRKASHDRAWMALTAMQFIGLTLEGKHSLAPSLHLSHFRYTQRNHSGRASISQQVWK